MAEAENAQKRRKFLDEYSNTLDIKAAADAAGFKKRTGIANATNYLYGERARRELLALMDKKAAHLQVCKGYIVAAYVKILDWALVLDDSGHPNDPALALRALDCMSKYLDNSAQGANNRADENNIENLPIISEIAGLDPTKI